MKSWRRFLYLSSFSDWNSFMTAGPDAGYTNLKASICRRDSFVNSAFAETINNMEFNFIVKFTSLSYSLKQKTA